MKDDQKTQVVIHYQVTILDIGYLSSLKGNTYERHLILTTKKCTLKRFEKNLKECM